MYFERVRQVDRLLLGKDPNLCYIHPTICEIIPRYTETYDYPETFLANWAVQLIND